MYKSTFATTRGLFPNKQDPCDTDNNLSRVQVYETNFLFSYQIVWMQHRYSLQESEVKTSFLACMP